MVYLLAVVTFGGIACFSVIFFNQFRKDKARYSKKQKSKENERAKGITE